MEKKFYFAKAGDSGVYWNRQVWHPVRFSASLLSWLLFFSYTREGHLTLVTVVQVQYVCLYVCLCVCLPVYNCLHSCALFALQDRPNADSHWSAPSRAFRHHGPNASISIAGSGESKRTEAFLWTPLTFIFILILQRLLQPWSLCTWNPHSVVSHWNWKISRIFELLDMRVNMKPRKVTKFTWKLENPYRKLGFTTVRIECIVVPSPFLLLSDQGEGTSPAC